VAVTRRPEDAEEETPMPTAKAIRDTVDTPTQWGEDE
jgi:hypothetical protein